MSDKTLGAYERYETPDTTRNANGTLYCPSEHDEFACSREDGHHGPHVAAGCDLQNSICEVWDQVERHEKHDADDFGEAVAEEAERRWPHEPASSALPTESRRDRRIGFMVGAKWGRGSVWECPAPDQHNSAHAIDWQGVAEEQEDMIHALVRERDNALAMAALWKETAREHVRRARTALSYADAARLARAVAAVTPCSCSAQRSRAEQAEHDRDNARRWLGETEALLDQAGRERIEALRTLKEVLDSHDETLRDIASGKYAAESRPLTPDAITDEMVERAARRYAEARNVWPAKVSWREVLTAALTPPARPEGAEEIETVLREEWSFSDEDGGEEAFADLAQRLAARGVRVIGEELS